MIYALAAIALFSSVASIVLAVLLMMSIRNNQADREMIEKLNDRLILHTDRGQSHINFQMNMKRAEVEQKRLENEARKIALDEKRIPTTESNGQSVGGRFGAKGHRRTELESTDRV